MQSVKHTAKKKNMQSQSIIAGKHGKLIESDSFPATPTNLIKREGKGILEAKPKTIDLLAAAN